jgi:hypothetical protein
MNKRWLPVASFILAVAIIAHLGCQGSGTPNVVHTPIVIVFSPTPQAVSTTIPLAANTALPIPADDGFSGTFTESGGVVAGATVKLTSYVKVPAGGPAPLARTRGSLSGATAASVGHAIFLIKQAYSAPMTFASFPSTTWQLPPSVTTTGPFELETIDGTTGLLLDTEYQTNLTGDVVTFPGNLAPFTTASGHIYWWELITGFASPPPAGCGSNNVTANVNPAGQTVDEPTLCNFTGSVQLSDRKSVV